MSDRALVDALRILVDHVRRTDPDWSITVGDTRAYLRHYGPATVGERRIDPPTDTAT